MTDRAASAVGVTSGRSDARALGLVRERAWAIAIWAAMIGWTVVLYSIVRGAYLDFRLGRFDLGNMSVSQLSLTMIAGGKMSRKIRPNPARRTTRMYSSSAIRRSAPRLRGCGSGVDGPVSTGGRSSTVSWLTGYSSA